MTAVPAGAAPPAGAALPPGGGPPSGVLPAAPAVRWVPAFAGAALMWGSSFLFIKVAVAELAPVYVAFGRVAFGALTLLVLLVVLRQRLPRDRWLWGHLALLAVVTNTIPFTLFAYAEQRVSSVLAGIWNGAAPLTTLAVTLIALRSERPSRRHIVGLLVGFLGVLIVLGAWRGVAGESLTGQLMLFGAVVCYGISFNYIRWLMRRRPETGLTLSAAQLSLSAAQLAVLAPLLAGLPPAPAELSGRVIASVLALGVFGSGLAFVLSYHVVRVAGVTTGSTITYLPPVVGAVAGVVVLNEQLTWNQPVGGLIVLAGVAFAQGLRWPRRPGPRSAGPGEAGPGGAGPGGAGPREAGPGWARRARPRRAPPRSSG